MLNEVNILESPTNIIKNKSRKIARKKPLCPALKSDLAFPDNSSDKYNEDSQHFKKEHPILSKKNTTSKKKSFILL